MGACLRAAGGTAPPRGVCDRDRPPGWAAAPDRVAATEKAPAPRSGPGPETSDVDGQVSWLAGPRPVALAFPDRSSDAARRGGTDDGLAAYSCGHSPGFSPRSPNRPAPMIAPPRTARKGAGRGAGA